MEEHSKNEAHNQRLLHCVDWLQKQNIADTKKELQNKNDIQFIIQTNAERKKFLLSAADDEASVPAGVGEPSIEPKPVPVRKLRKQGLNMECEWTSCGKIFTDYELLQKHVTEHYANVKVVQKKNDSTEYVCLWDVCGFASTDYQEMVRHINYHSFHAFLLSVGYNARATMNLARCRRDSGKRNTLPPFKSEFQCHWVECGMKFNFFQNFLDHVKTHVRYANDCVCSWAGCGAKLLDVNFGTHMRSHTLEKVIACYHCGRQFASNRKLREHLMRQNVIPSADNVCTVCGAAQASSVLLRNHMRQHVSLHACTLCDMTSPKLSSLAKHMRYRHLGVLGRAYACTYCDFRAVTHYDLKRHTAKHLKCKVKKAKENASDPESENNEENSESEHEPDKKKKKLKLKPKQERRQFMCHICESKKNSKVYGYGHRLTKHLFKVHGASMPNGFTRFRYQICDDGVYRLQTTRYEILEVSKKIVDGGPKNSISNTFEFELQQKAEPTLNTPRKFEITLKTNNIDDTDSVKEEPRDIDLKEEAMERRVINEEIDIERHPVKIEPNDDNNELQINNDFEIEMCDVDEFGNIISAEIITKNSDVVFTRL